MKFLNWFRRKKTKRLSVKGEYHDLLSIYHQLNHHYFEGKLALPIGWFGSGTPRAKRAVRLGSYHLQKRCIKINRLLDKPEIPHFFISFIVYHEMLHHLYPPIVRRYRRKIHHPQFKEQERLFLHYEEALLFGKKHQALWFL